MFQKAFAIRPALIVGLMAATLASPALAQQQPSSGLGSAWPTDAPDVSRTPGYHAYAWVKAGVKYVQINDYSGNVLAAFATADGTFLPLPMGRDAANLQIPQDSPTATPTDDSSSGVAVYQDDSVKVMATPQPNGVVSLLVVSTCTNPVECSTHITSAH
ncbi:MAG TPA: hypothetical protein VGC19_15420 [Rhodanobacter sp.]